VRWKCCRSIATLTEQPILSASFSRTWLAAAPRARRQIKSAPVSTAKRVKTRRNYVSEVFAFLRYKYSSSLSVGLRRSVTVILSYARVQVWNTSMMSLWLTRVQWRTGPTGPPAMAGGPVGPRCQPPLGPPPFPVIE